MNKLEFKYGVTGKALPPQPIRMKIPGWGGAAAEMKNGSEPQPWHCPPFVEASTHGFELIYQYESECQVINDDGDLRFEWDYAKEPGIKLHGEEFAGFFPRPSKYYLFETSLDLQAPPGYVLRTQPHPRFFTDDTGTVPLPMIGHVQTEWWPKRLFVVFRVPPPGQRHIFRHGEPYVQILFVQQLVSYQATRMSPEEEARRRELEQAIAVSGAFIARNVWFNPAAHEFKDHYKVLGRTFSLRGQEGVAEAVRNGAERYQKSVPKDKTIAECLSLGFQRQREGKFIEARTIYLHLLTRDPNNAEAMSRLGAVTDALAGPTLATELMARAVELQPASPTYRSRLGEMLRRRGRYEEAEAWLRSSLQISPNDPRVLSSLGLALAQRGQVEEGLEICRRALAIGAQVPVAQLRMGLVLAQQGQYDDARACYQAALALDATYAEAQEALNALPGGTPQETAHRPRATP